MQKSMPGVGLFQCVVSHLLSYTLARRCSTFCQQAVAKKSFDQIQFAPCQRGERKNGGGDASCASESQCVVKYGVNGMDKKKNTRPHGAALQRRVLKWCCTLSSIFCGQLSQK
jgi:hypothetical protein